MLKTLRDILGKPIVIRPLGAVLLAVVIWFVGPLIAIAGFAPLGSWIVRLVLIALIFGFVGYTLYRDRKKAAEAGNGIVQDLASQRAEAGVAEIGQKFDAALDQLGGGNRTKLYELPWYVMIGPPGSGKTTALRNAGLGLYNDQAGDVTVAGIGGTRNCDWLFADEAVLIDTAGRFTTQDSDQNTDAQEWLGFLSILKKRRPRQPLNGLIVAVPADTLAGQQDVRDRQARQIRARIKEVTDQLGMRLPVYVVLTKADRLSGFEEFFSELTAIERSQVLGFTFPLDRSEDGAAVSLAASEFDALSSSVAARLHARIEQDRDPARRVRMITFLQELANLKGPLQSFLTKCFRPDAFKTQPLLRGFYLSSATQEGSPIDRVLGSMMAGLDTPSAAIPSRGATKTFFLERLLKDTILTEAGVAGTNQTAEANMQKRRTVFVAALGVLTVLTIIGWGFSWRKNASMIAQLEGQTAAYVAGLPEGGSADLEEVTTLLNQLRALTFSQTAGEGFRTSGWSLGLGQRRAIRPRVEGAYHNALDQMLLPLVMADLGTDVNGFANQPAAQYEILKTYLTAGGLCAASDKGIAALVTWVNGGWAERYPGTRFEPLRRDLTLHTSALFDNGRAVTASSLLLDGNLIARARRNVAALPEDARLYAVLKAEASADSGEAMTVRRLAGERANAAFAESGVTVPGLFTGTFYRDELSGRSDRVIRQAADESCVLGDDVASRASTPTPVLKAAIEEQYLSDFVEQWDLLLSSVQRADAEGDAVIEQIRTATRLGQVSPVRALVQEISTLTDVSTPETAVDRGIDATAAGLAQRAPRPVRAMAGGDGRSGDVSETVVAAFAPWRQAVSGDPGQSPVDEALRVLSDYGQALSDNANARPSEQQTTLADARAAGRRLEGVAEQLPRELGRWFTSYVRAGSAVAASSGRAALNSDFQASVEDVCQSRIAGRFPLRRGARDEVGLGDFEAYFGDGGTVDMFSKDKLSPYIDRVGREWVVTPEGEQLGIDSRMVASFQAAQDVRDAYFQGGAPGASFSLIPVSVTGALEVRLTALGETITYANGAARPARLSWPGPGGEIRISFRGSDGQTKGKSWEGDWGFFRMLSESQRRRVDGRTAQYTVTVGEGTFVFQISANSVVNPFTSTAINQVSCRGPAAS
ncbi:MAG: type VI secretion system membrane subunit TssM [Pseudomonadota bacterium]